jgi:oligopeptide transport system substrate-binding protein
MRKLFYLLSLLIVASMLLAACGGAAPTEEPPAPAPVEPAAPAPVEPAAPAPAEPEMMTCDTPLMGAEPMHAVQDLRVNLGTFPDIIDPQKSSFVNEIAHLTSFYEGLTKLNGDLDTVPGAAESWTYNADSTELTFKLRDCLMYSDGTLLNAERFRYSLLRNINPETAGEYAAITDEVNGAAEWRGGDAAAQAIVEESVVASHADGSACTGYDDVECTTFKLTLKQPAPYFHTVMSLWVVFPAKEELITEGGETWWLEAKYHVGNGPFILESMEPQVSARMIPNPYYWGGQPSINLEFAYITDSAVSFEAYKNDEFDIVGLAAEDFDTIMADPTLSQEATIYPGSCTFAVMFHQAKAPFTDKAVREAFAYALDRDAWVKDVLKGLGAPTLTWIPPGFPGYQEGETRLGFDANKAVQTLTDAGYKVEGGQLIGPDGVAIEIVQTFSDTPRNRTRNEWLVAKFKEVLGIDIALNPVESTTYTALTKDVATAPQMFILGWCADYPDPQNWLSVYWKTGAFGDRIAYSNPDLDALLVKADTEGDPATRAQLYADAQDMLVGGSPVAFMWNNVNTYMVKPWVKGLSLTPMDPGYPGQYVPTEIYVEK